jgi:hypothetical protein
MPLKIVEMRCGVGIRVLDRLRAKFLVTFVVGLLAVATTV